MTLSEFYARWNEAKGDTDSGWWLPDFGHVSDYPQAATSIELPVSEVASLRIEVEAPGTGTGDEAIARVVLSGTTDGELTHADFEQHAAAALTLIATASPDLPKDARTTALVKLQDGKAIQVGGVIWNASEARLDGVNSTAMIEATFTRPSEP
jgi:hypothetical protein